VLEFRCSFWVLLVLSELMDVHAGCLCPQGYKFEIGLKRQLYHLDCSYSRETLGGLDESQTKNFALQLKV